MEDSDKESMGIQTASPDSPPMFFGDVVLKRALVFPDGTMQTTAASGAGGNVDGGTY